MSGHFISFEGTEGCGKSTQLGLLAERLRSLGREVRELREPGGTVLGEELRQILKRRSGSGGMTPEAELLLMNAARAQLVREVIRPALARGEILLCDRFYHSSLAYQGWGRQLDLKWVRTVIDFAVGETRPELALLFVIPPEVSVARRQERERRQGLEPDRFEVEDDGFFRRVAEGFRAIAAEEPSRFRIIDAGGTVEQVRAVVWEAALAVIQTRGPGGSG
ncbi:MAG: dTMP kinase [Verrucomicrobiales bacterium]|nr:dTMP kinase [Verrucomicrobiales bacterium]